MIKDKWENCYDQGWGKNLVPEAFSHPAKVSFSLAAKIYDHAINEGWVKKGDLILDPFSGIGGFAFHALCYGLNFIGVELEEKFVKLGQQNIELWNRKMKGWPNLGTATIIQGDSRNLKDVIEKTDLVVSSPPYSDEVSRDRASENYAQSKNDYKRGGKSQYEIYGHTPGNLANLKEGNFDMCIGSPPFTDCHSVVPIEGHSRQVTSERVKGIINYGQSPGQLGAMKEGSIDAVISSPPYVDSVKGEHEEKETASESRSKRKTKGGSLGQSQRFGGYGKSLSQLGSMKEGGFDAVVGSPPWDEGSQTPKFECKPQSPKHQGGPQWGPQYEKQQTLGKGDTFWSASKIIVQQCYELLKPSGISIWVCKDYIKGGRRIPFSQRWATLCESVGFELIHWHKASLIKEFGTQITTMNGDEKIRSEKKSFFRRLAEKKGSPRIDEEDILCLIKPLAEGK